MPLKGELKVKEYDVFKGYYCGLCKAIGNNFNQLSRLSLNYDLTFLALLLSSLDNEADKVKKETCIVSPFKKKPIIQPNIHIDYTAYISIILTYFKLMDDWKDEKSGFALSASLPFWLSLRKVKKIYNDKYNKIKKQLYCLNELEKMKCSVVDETADAFSKLMEEIATPPYIQNEKQIRILKWLGYNIGRWIYIIDAFNDIEKDIKKENYNPLLLQYEYNKNEDLLEFKKRIREPVELTLTFTLDNIAKSFELLDIKYNRGILQNIIYMGTRHKMHQILGKGVVKHEKSI